MSLIAVRGVQDILTLPNPLLGASYPFIEHGAHLRACGHPTTLLAPPPPPRHKLTVHARVYKRSGTDKCPVCSQKEMVKHAMVECSMFKAAAAVIQHYYGQVTTDNGTSTVRDMMESDDQEWLLNTNQGWSMWSARSAHWQYQCEVKAGASPVFTSYLTTWLRELCESVGFYTGERREQWRGFQKSLEQLRDTGVQPRQGEVHVHGGLNAWWQTHKGLLHPREISQQSQLAKGNGITPEAPEAGRPGSATRSARSDCRTGAEGLHDSVHGPIVEKTGPQGHAQGRGLWRVRGGRWSRTRGTLLRLRTNTSQANK